MSQFFPHNTTHLWLKLLGFALIGVALGTAVGWQIAQSNKAEPLPTTTPLPPSPTSEPTIFPTPDGQLPAALTREATAVEAQATAEANHAQTVRQVETLTEELHLAQAQYMAQTALAVQGRNPMQALLLAATAHQVVDIPATNAAVQQVFQQFGRIERTIDLGFGPNGRAMATQDGQHLLAWGQETVALWSLETMELLWSNPVSEPVEGVQFSADEQFLVVWGKETAALYAGSTGEWLYDLPLENGGVREVVWRTDGRQFLTQGGRIAIVWDTATGMPLWSFSLTHFMQGAKWNPSETLIATWGCDDELLYSWYCEIGITVLWDATTGEKQMELRQRGHVNGVDWNREETQLLAWGRYHQTVVWDLAKATPKFILPVAHEVFGASWNEEETQILTWGCVIIKPTFPCYSGGVDIWSAETGEHLYPLYHQYHTQGRWSRDSQRILTVGTRQVMVWQASSGEKSFTLEPEIEHELAIWNEAETRLLTGNSCINSAQDVRDCALMVWDGVTGEHLLTIPQTNLQGFWWDEAHGRIFIWSHDGQLTAWQAPIPVVWHTETYILWHTLWNAGQNQLLRHVCGGFGGDGCFYRAIEVWDVVTAERIMMTEGWSYARWNHDGSQLLVWEVWPEKAAVLDSQTGMVLQQVEGETAVAELTRAFEQNQPALEPALPLPYRVSWDSYNINIWETAQESYQKSIPHQLGSLIDVQWYNQQTELLVWSKTEIALFDVETGTELQRYRFPDDVLYEVGWWEEGRTLWFASQTQFSYIHVVPADEQHEAICQLATRNLTQAEWQTYLGGQPYRPLCEK